MRFVLSVFTLALILTSTATAPAVSATAANDSLFVVPRIVVEAKRIPVAADAHRSGFVETVDLGERGRRVEDLATVLTNLVGVRVAQYGGLGSFATLSIRGSSSNQVRIFLDGIPLDDAYSGVSNLADLSLGGIQKIEVYRGFTPTRFGASAIGGAVNLVTRSPETWNPSNGAVRAEVRESYGSFATARHEASLWTKPARVSAFAHAGYTKSLGDFSYLDDEGTPFEPDDDLTVNRINNDLAAFNALARIQTQPWKRSSLVFGHDVVTRHQGVPGLGVNPSPSARFKRSRRITHVEFEAPPLLSGRLHSSLRAHYDKTVEQFSDPLGTLGPARQETDNALLDWGGNARAKWFFSRVPATAELVLEGRKETFHPASKIPEPRTGPDRRRRSNTIAAAIDVYLLHQTLVLSATQRWSKHIDEFYDEEPLAWLPPSPQGRVAKESRTPSFGARWHPLPPLTVKANLGRYYRLPTFLELFGNAGSVTGASDLEPEEGVNRDVGLVVTLDRVGPLRRLFLEAVYLDNEVENLILYFPNSQHTSKPVNIGSARIKGWEYSAVAALGRMIRLSANYTRLDTRDTSDIPFYQGKRLPSRPLDDSSVSATIEDTYWSVTYEVHHVGPNYLDRANLREVAARDFHNLILRFDTPLPHSSLTIEARNLSDDQTGDVGGYPLPGRSFFVTLGYTL